MSDKNIKNEWVILIDEKIYELKMINSLYELHIKDIYSIENCFKMKTINILIIKTWNADEKTIFITMKSTNAFILYWINSKWKSIR